MSQLIDDYLQSIETKLGFDLRLAQRAREDIEEYLHELIDDRLLSPQDAISQAIAGFGDSNAVAGEYAASGLGRQISLTWVSVILAVIGAFVAMRLRAMSVDIGSNGVLTALLWIDRFALAACLCFAAIGRLGHTHHLGLRVCAPQTAFKVSILAIACSISAGLARVGLASDVISWGWPIAVVVATATVEITALVAASVRVRTMELYFERAKISPLAN